VAIWHITAAADTACALVVCLRWEERNGGLMSEYFSEYIGPSPKATRELKGDTEAEPLCGSTFCMRTM